MIGFDQQKQLGKSKFMKVLICFILALTAINVCVADQVDYKITGIYSDLDTNEDSGDLLGMEFFLFLGDNKYYVLVQSAEGVPYRPALVHCAISGNKLMFTLPPSKTGYTGTFKGTVFADRIEGIMQNGQVSPATGQKIIILKKGNSYWQ